MGDNTTWGESLIGGVIWPIQCTVATRLSCILSDPHAGKVVSVEMLKYKGEAEKWILHKFDIYCLQNSIKTPSMRFMALH